MIKQPEMDEARRLLPFVSYGTAGAPNYTVPALSDYHPPRSAADREGYLTDSVLALDAEGYHIRLVLSGRWHAAAARIARSLRFRYESPTTVKADKVDSSGIDADNWELREYKLMLPEEGDTDAVMIGHLTWGRGDEEDVQTSWRWIHRLREG